jgi:hypothetical protein
VHFGEKKMHILRILCNAAVNPHYKRINFFENAQKQGMRDTRVQNAQNHSFNENHAFVIPKNGASYSDDFMI